MDYKYYLYRHIRLDKNCPFYIGIGTTKKSNGFKTKHCRAFEKVSYKRNDLWLKIVHKTEFKVQILITSNDKKFIEDREKEFIALYGRIDLGTGTLANLTSGGAGQPDCFKREETIKKLRRGRLYASIYIYHIPTRKLVGYFTSTSGVAQFLNIRASTIGTMLKRDGQASYKEFFITQSEITDLNIFDKLSLGKKTLLGAYNQDGKLLYMSTSRKEITDFLKMGDKKFNFSLKNQVFVNLFSDNAQRRIIRSDGRVYENIKAAGRDNGCYGGMPIRDVVRGRKDQYNGFNFEYEGNSNEQIIIKVLSSTET